MYVQIHCRYCIKKKINIDTTKKPDNPPCTMIRKIKKALQFKDFIQHQALFKVPSLDFTKKKY